MLRPRQADVARRRGIILLVVISMLTLFAIIGISFVLYAQSEATSARVNREAEQFPRPDVDPELLLSYFLQQFIYGVTNNTNSSTWNNYSSMQGHDLMTNMLGASTTGPGANRTPYCGSGRIQSTGEIYYINYQDRSKVGGGPRRKPEYWNNNSAYVATNPPYTYPDINNMFLAAVQADGTVLIPSWLRPWATKPGIWQTSLRPADLPPPEDGFCDVKNLQNSPGYWDGSQYHYNDSIWMDLGFPVQTSLDGRKYKPLFASLIVDLDNRINLRVHGNLMGTSFTPPSSPGTPPSQATTHASNQGWGRWEVNISKVLPDSIVDQTSGLPEWQNIFTGNPNYPTAPPGRYGPNKVPGSPGKQGTYPQGRFYSMVDYNSSRDVTAAGGGPLPFGNIPGPTGALRLPGQPGSRSGPPPSSCFPYYNSGPRGKPASTQQPPGTVNWDQSDRGWGNGVSDNLQDHASRYDVWAPGGDDGTIQYYRATDMEGLLRYSDTGSPALTSNLFRLCPNNFANVRTRNLVTTFSFDWNRPGATPYIWDPKASQLTWAPPANVPPGQVAPATYPKGDPIKYPSQLGTVPPSGSEFARGNWHNQYSTWVTGNATKSFPYRFDLNMKLPAYPAPDPGTGRIVDMPRFKAAVDARQLMVQELFNRLKALTGGGDQDSQRWLAQLAVNMVDYIDHDGYTPQSGPEQLLEPVITAFDWSGNGDYVYGTELPRVLINEVYAEMQNLPAASSSNDPDPNHDPGMIPQKAKGAKGGGSGNVHATKFRVHVWAELLNPLRNNSSDQSQKPNSMDDASFAAPKISDSAHFDKSGAAAALERPRFPNNTGPVIQPPFGGYRILLTKHNNNIRARNNPRGYPDDTKLASQGGHIWDREDYYTDNPPKADPKNQGQTLKRLLTFKGNKNNQDYPDGNPVACVVDRWNYRTNQNSPDQPKSVKDPAGGKTQLQQWPPNPQNGNPFTQTILGSDDKTSGVQGNQGPPASGGNQGYYVLAPEVAFPGGGVKPSLMRPEMSYDVRPQDSNNGLPTTDVNSADPAKNCQPTVILQRLLCPYLPPNYQGMENEFPPTNRESVDLQQAQGANVYPPPAQAQYDPNKPYNPYITVDYMEDVWVNDARTNIGKSNRQGGTAQTPVTSRHSNVRKEPYAGLFVRDAKALSSGTVQADVTKSQVVPCTGGTSKTGPKHTLFNENTPHNSTFHWLTHMDRELISPMELLQVSTYAPHELTQQFAIPDPKNLAQPLYYQHRAFWDDQQNLQASRVYRLFEFLHCHDRGAGMVSTVTLTVKKVASQGEADAQGLTPYSFALSGLHGVPGNGWGVPWRLGDPAISATGSGPKRMATKGATMVTIWNPNATPSNMETVMITNSTDRTITVKLRLPSHGVGDSVIFWHIDERLPGQINLNTLWDPEVFSALCDGTAGPAGANSFSDADVKNIFNQMVQMRTPSSKGGRPMPGPNDRPFKGMGQGWATSDDPQYPYGAGIEDSWLRSIPNPNQGGDDGQPQNNTPVNRLFDLPAQNNPVHHPYVKNLLLNKIYNTITCRSNVFAVWLTVGFFEVVDNSVIPPKLGNEIGSQEPGRVIRHRMFAIVDRSAEATSTQNAEGPPGANDNAAYYTTSATAIPGGGVTMPIQLANTTGITIGSRIEIYEIQMVQPPPSPIFGPGGRITGYNQGKPQQQTVNDETTTVTDLTPLDQPVTVTAKFSKAHAAGSTVKVILNYYPDPRHNARNGESQFHSDQRCGTVPFRSVIR
jgi:hypothetical protein